MKKLAVILAVSCLPFAANAAVDAEAAQALLKKSDCFKCHAIDKKKDGPPYKEVAKKHKGKADAEDKLFKHMTTTPMVEIDGKKILLLNDLEYGRAGTEAKVDQIVSTTAYEDRLRTAGEPVRLTSVLDLRTRTLVSFASNEKELVIQHGTFEIAT